MNRDTASLPAPNEIAPKPIHAHAATTPSQPYQVFQPIGVLGSLGNRVYFEGRLLWPCGPTNASPTLYALTAPTARPRPAGCQDSSHSKQKAQPQQDSSSVQ